MAAQDAAREPSPSRQHKTVPAAIVAALVFVGRRTLFMFALTVASSMLYRALQSPTPPAELQSPTPPAELPAVRPPCLHPPPLCSQTPNPKRSSLYGLHAGLRGFLLCACSTSCPLRVLPSHLQETQGRSPVQSERLVTYPELAKYHSDNSERIMLAVLGQVFDVSAKRNIYGADVPRRSELRG
jgi:hypothetical protein